MLRPDGLTNPDIQQTLLGEAAAGATVGFLVWDDDRRYIAANAEACALLGCTLQEIVGSEVGARTEGGEDLAGAAVRTQRARGRALVHRFDGAGDVTIEYVTFSTRTAGLPFMATVIWKADSDPG